MGYDVFAFVLAVGVVGLLWERYTMNKELNKVKTIAALLIAEKMGMRIDGREVEIAIDEMGEKKV